MKTQLTKRLAYLGVASLCALGALTGCSTSVAPSTTAPQTSEGTVSSTSPMGDRPMITIDGNRYVFLNNGEAFELTEDQLGAQVGEQNEGTLYELNNYNKDFRMAFEHNDSFYIGENVGKADDSAIDIAKHLETANIQGHLLSTDIFDHMGGNILKALDREDAIKLLDTFATAEIAPLENADYEAIANAQYEGKSYRVEFMLDDYTTFTSFVIPSMNYITIGDYTCIIEDFDAQIGSYFENLVVSENIIYN